MGGTVTRSVLRRLHRWIGLALALPMIVMAVTGLIMMANPFAAFLAGIPAASRQLTASDDLHGVDVAAILAAAVTAAPPGQEPRRWRPVQGAVAVDFASAGQQQAMSQVAVDAHTAKVLWVRQNPDSFYRWIHSVHETLLMGLAGRGIVGWIGVALLSLALSGIPLWWPARGRWSTGLTITRGARGWRLQRDLHAVVGIWVILLLLLQSVSGIAMAFPQTARAIAGLPALGSRGPRPPEPARPPEPGRADLVRVIIAGLASAQAAIPDAVVQDLRLPALPGRPMMAVLLPSGHWQGAPGALVSMDPATARIVSVQAPGTNSSAASILDWLRSAHEGGAAGPAGRVLMCLFAIVLPLFPVTGVAMWTLRRRRRRHVARTSVIVVAGE